jgi:hypothetical protein
MTFDSFDDWYLFKAIAPSKRIMPVQKREVLHKMMKNLPENE